MNECIEKKWSLVVAQETTDALEVFTSGNVDKLVGQLEGEVKSIVCDVTTLKGRKEIASLAHKVSRSKIVLDSLGKGLVGRWKEKSKAVDLERKQIRDRLDALRDEVRKPLTEWEETEKARIEKEKLDKEIIEAHEQALPENDLFNRQKELERKEAEQRQRLEKQEAEQRQRLEKQEAEEAERAKIEREEQIHREAVEEEKRRAEREQNENERKRLSKEADEKVEAERKSTDKRHQKNVNNVILKKLLAIGIGEEHAKLLIIKTAENEVPNLKITY